MYIYFYLQANDKTIRRTSDHSPATWIHGILIPILKNIMRISQKSLNAYQSLHYKVYKKYFKKKKKKPYNLTLM